MTPAESMLNERMIRALESIAGSLGAIAQPARLGKPHGDGLIKLLERIAAALEATQRASVARDAS